MNPSVTRAIVHPGGSIDKNQAPMNLTLFNPDGSPYSAAESPGQAGRSLGFLNPTWVFEDAEAMTEENVISLAEGFALSSDGDKPYIGLAYNRLDPPFIVRIPYDDNPAEIIDYPLGHTDVWFTRFTLYILDFAELDYYIDETPRYYFSGPDALEDGVVVNPHYLRIGYTYNKVVAEATETDVNPMYIVHSNGTLRVDASSATEDVRVSLLNDGDDTFTGRKMWVVEVDDTGDVDVVLYGITVEGLGEDPIVPEGERWVIEHDGDVYRKIS